MMAPSATPVLLLFAGLQARRTEGRVPFAVSLFALGYAIVWIGFCAGAALAQWALHDTAVMSAPMTAASGRVGGAILCRGWRVPAFAVQGRLPRALPQSRQLPGNALA